MAVAIGWHGNVTIRTSSTDRPVAEMGSWSISGPNRNMVEVNAFGDSVARQELGTLTGQTITFEGYHDAASATSQQNVLIGLAGSGAPVYGCSDQGMPSKLRLWANDDTSLPGYGFWALSTADSTTSAVYITNVEVAQSKDGLETISFTGAVSGADLKWSSGPTT